MIVFQCPKCQKTLKAPEEKIGARSKCPYCQCPVQIPQGTNAPVAAYALPAEVAAEGELLDKHGGDNPEYKTRRGSKLWLLALVPAGLIFLCCGGCGLLSFLGRNTPREPAKVVEAQDLLRDFASNNVRAKTTYGGTIQVRGRVTGFLGDAVLLENHPAITCFGLSRHEVNRLNRGSTAIIEGYVSIGNTGGVWLNSCTLVSAE